MPKEQKAQKTFGLRDVGAMVEKLRWEAGKLSTLERHNVTERQYHAFNGAVTAWHITDWLWHTSDDVKQKWPKVDDFQEFVRNDCPMLRLCYQVATGSKHCLIKNMRADPSISADISQGEGYKYGNPIIIDGDTAHLAQDVFYKALFWFEAFIHAHQLFPEEPLIPHGDTP